uniref:transcription factor Jun-like isoform X2 n=1 Tax=Pristiophorus japonicus TaxID=55135 RepID=UPI00398EC592
MAAPFYHDETVSVSVRRYPETAPMEKKSAADRRQQQQQQQQPPPVVGSPERSALLTLSSSTTSLADLDRLAVAQADGPGVGRELEGLVHPFVKALQDLHKQNQHLVLPGTPCSAHTSTSIYHGNLHLAQTKGDVPVYTNLSNYNPSLSNTGSENYSTGHVPYAGPAPAQHHFSALAQLVCPKYQEEPQTVPEVGPLSESPPLSPIEQGGQQVRAEKKRQRNRIAASNCRRRKLERIARLEDKVKTLKSENIELTSTASVLREQVVHLKHKVMNHVNNGCQVVLASSSLLKPEENGSF